jgi:ABC-type nitrate/sulfonate/bicarbonate transport system permease component
MGFQKIVEGGFSAFLRRYRRMMTSLESRIAGMSKDQAESLDRMVIGINVVLFVGIVVCMWMDISRWIQFALAVALYIGYQVFHRAFHDVIKGKG